MAVVLGFLAIFIILCISVALHESGHLITAKQSGLGAKQYMVGFGPALWKKQINGTEYSFRLIPLGGGTVVYDPDHPDEDDDDEMSASQLLIHVHPLKRFYVYVAGPAFNLILGTLLLFTFFVATPGYEATTTVDSTCTNSCPAKTAGIQTGDKITSINGHETHPGEALGDYLEPSGNTIVVEREGQPILLENVETVEENGTNMLGVRLKTNEVDRTVGESISDVGNYYVRGAEAIVALPSKIPNLVQSIVGGDRDENGPVSVVGAGRGYGEVAATDQITTADKGLLLIYFAGGINIALGLFNLIPILPLDGGRILISGIDALRMGYSKVFRKGYSPVSVKTISLLTGVFAVGLIGLMALVIIADIVNPIHLF